MPNSQELNVRVTNTNLAARRILNEGVVRCYMELWAPLFQQHGYTLKPGWEKRHDLALQTWCHLVLQRIDDPQFYFAVDFNLVYGDRLTCNRGVFGKPHGGECRMKGDFTDFFNDIEVRYKKWVKAGRPVNVTYD